MGHIQAIENTNIVMRAFINMFILAFIIGAFSALTFGIDGENKRIANSLKCKSE